MKDKAEELEEKMMESAKDLVLHMKRLNLTYEQAKSLNSKIIKHVDDCVRWGIQVKLGTILKELKEAEK
ncbi:hypothetical protein [Fusobacterium necrophorum]|uniref:hypothetical protein n=1 Tax=Fusobacterium necrophorum TaxID=859 RepID=UPI003D9A9B3F